MPTLVHEATHQLSFNTGLLNREGDTPLCIVEGLGTYGESRDSIGTVASAGATGSGLGTSA